MKRFPLFSLSGGFGYRKPNHCPLAGLLLSGLIFLPLAFSQTTNETLTISTYYPSPYGVYNELRLYPKTTPTTCDSLTEGNMYYNSTTDEVMVCKGIGGSYSWQSMSGLWTLNGTNLYPNNTTWNVGIGTTEPKLPLHIKTTIDGWAMALQGPPSAFTAYGLTSDYITGWGIGMWGKSTAAPTTEDFGIGYYNGASWNIPFVIDKSTGNVGIGTANPQTSLHVVATGTVVPPLAPRHRVVIQDNGAPLNAVSLVLLGGNAGGSGVDFGDTDAIATGRILYRHETDSMQFFTNAAERLRIDNAGNVGIGTIPGSVAIPGCPGCLVRLDVRGNILALRGNSPGGASPTGILIDEDSPAGAGVSAQAGYSLSRLGVQQWAVGLGSDNSFFIWNPSDGEAIHIATPGGGSKVGIRNNSPAFPLDVGGAIQANEILTTARQNDCPVGWTCAVKTWDISASGVYYTTALPRSDARLKREVASLTDGLRAVKNLQGVSFRWKDGVGDSAIHYGFIAQDVEKVIPRLVHETKDGMKSVEIDGIIPILVEAVKEQQAQIEGLKSDIEVLNKKNNGSKPQL